jgi:hypothetical protein
MAKKKTAPQQPLSADAAWTAAKNDIARRNEEAHERMTVKRAAQAARIEEHRLPTRKRP